MLTFQVFLDSFSLSFKSAPSLWYFSFFIIFLAIFILIIRRFRLARANMFEIDKMSGDEFESYLEILFKSDGYKVTHVGSHNGDYGADLILEKDNKRIAVQAKCWHNTVGEKAIQEVISSKAVYNCQEAMVITNNWFSFQAQYLAKANKIDLWDRNDLVSAILRIRKQK